MSSGIIAAIAAALAAGLIPVLTKALMLDGFSAVTILFYRYLFVVVFLGTTLLVKKTALKITPQQGIELLIFSIFGYGGSTFLLAQAFNFMPMGLATMLYFGYPIFVVLIMGLVFREKPERNKIIALGVAVSGIVFLMDFDFRQINWGSILALGSGLAYGIYLVSLQKSSLEKMENQLIVFYLGAISTMVFGLQGCLTSGAAGFLQISPRGMFLTFILGGVTIFVLQMVTYAINKIGSSQTSLIIAFEAVVALVLGIICYHEPWNGNNVIGSVLMLAAVVLISLNPPGDGLSQSSRESPMIRGRELMKWLIEKLI